MTIMEVGVMLYVVCKSHVSEIPEGIPRTVRAISYLLAFLFLLGFKFSLANKCADTYFSLYKRVKKENTLI